MRFKSELFKLPVIMADEQLQNITEAFDALFNGSDDEDENKEKDSEYKAFIPRPQGNSTTPKKDHECEEGMTDLGGWMICKHCGANLRKI